jgi:hypothetical protein
MANGESVILGTDLASPLQINSDTGPLSLDELSFPPAKKKPQWVDGLYGAVLADQLMAYEDAAVSGVVRVDPQATFDLTRAEYAKFVDMLQEAERRGDDGLPCSYTPAAGGTTYTWYLLLGEIDDLPLTHESGYFASSPTLQFTLTRKPALYRPEVVGTPVTASLPVVEVEVANVPGDLPAETRVIVDDLASKDRRFVEVGAEQFFYSHASPAPLLIDSDSLVVTGLSGAQTTRTGAYDPNGTGNNVIRATLATVTTRVCSTGDQPHIGSFRCRARLWATADTVRARLVYQVGDGPLRANPFVSTPVVGAFVDVDLGQLTVEPVTLGTQKWVGWIEAFGANGDTIDVDHLRVMPDSVAYAKARGVSTSTTSILQAYDDFAGTVAGSALGTRTPPLGAAWATSGAATDFTFADAPTVSEETLQRATTGESGSNFTVGRRGVFGSNMTDQQVSARVYHTARPAGVNATVETGVIGRFVDASNYLAAIFADTSTAIGSGSSSLRLYKVVAGTVTQLASVTNPKGTGTWNTMGLTAYASGLIIAELLSTSGAVLGSVWFVDSVAATGGALASGKGGVADRSSFAAVITRNFDDVQITQPPAEGVALYSGRGMQFRFDGTIRESAAGGTWGEIPYGRGSRMFIPPAGPAGRYTRVAVSVRRYDVEVSNDDGLTDSTRVTVAYRPRYLVAR